GCHACHGPYSRTSRGTPRTSDRRPSRSAGAAVGPPGVADALERLVPERIDARPDGQGVRDEHVQALDAIRHAAGTDALDLGHLAELGAAAQVVLVGGAVGGGEVGVVGDPRRHLLHRTARLERAHRRDGGRAREVEGGRERGAVLEPGRRAHHERAAAHAARGDLHDPARRATQLLGDDREVLLADLRHQSPTSPATWAESHTVRYQGPVRGIVAGPSSPSAATSSPVTVSGSTTTKGVSPGMTKPSLSRACDCTYCSSLHRSIALSSAAVRSRDAAIASLSSRSCSCCTR